MKRTLLISLILGTVLVLAPATRAVVLSAESGGAGGGLVFHADVLGGSGTAPASTLQPVVVTDGWMASITPATLRPDTLGGDGGASTREAPIATGGDSFAWGDVTIGAAALAGALLLAFATLTVTRRRHALGF
jgi:hypothetical protein